MILFAKYARMRDLIHAKRCGFHVYHTPKGVRAVPTVKVERVSKETIKKIAGWMG